MLSMLEIDLDELILPAASMLILDWAMAELPAKLVASTNNKLRVSFTILCIILFIDFKKLKSILVYC